MRAPTLGLMPRLFCILSLGAPVGGCASAQLETAGSLASYDGMTPADGMVTKSKLRIDKSDVLAAKTISIKPTTFSNSTMEAQLTEQQRRVIANAIDRSICIGVSDRFTVVPSGQTADLNVHVTLTHITVTNATAAGISKVASAVPMLLSAGVPVMVPRIPYGMGSLSAEAEAKDARGQQKAAFVWARGADALTSKPRISASGDAYDLASEFGADFSKLLKTGENPFDKKIALPTSQQMQSSLGGKPKFDACDAFGRTGVTDFVAARLGEPPEWTDDATPVAQ